MNGLSASFFNRNVDGINSDVCGLYGPRTYGASLSLSPISAWKKGREIHLLSVRTGYLYIAYEKKDGNNGDNGLTYGRRGYEVVSYFDTRARTVYRCAASPRVSPSADRSRYLARPVMASNRDSVHSPLISSASFGKEEGEKWPRVEERHGIAPVPRRLVSHRFLPSPMSESSLKCTKRAGIRAFSCIRIPRDASAKNYCYEQETGMNIETLLRLLTSADTGRRA